MPQKKKKTKQQKALLKKSKAFQAKPRHASIPEYVLQITEQHFITIVMMSWSRVTDIITDQSIYPTMFSRFVDICAYGWCLATFCSTVERAKQAALHDYAEDDPELDMVLAAFKLKRELFPDDLVTVTEAEGDYNNGDPLFRLKFDTEILEDWLADGEITLPKQEELAEATAIASAMRSGKTTAEQMAALSMLERFSKDEEEQ